jgi:hypothetical protein
MTIFSYGTSHVQTRIADYAELGAWALYPGILLFPKLSTHENQGNPKFRRTKIYLLINICLK